MRDLLLRSRLLVAWETALRATLVLALALGLLGIITMPRPAAAETLPAITYANDCPPYSQFIADVASAGAGQSLTITFATGVSCDYGVGQTVVVQPGADVTIVGNGLNIYGGGNSISLISVGSQASLNLSGTTLWDAKNGIDADDTTGASISLTNCTVKGNSANGIDLGMSTNSYVKATETVFSANVDNGIGAADSSDPTIVLTGSEFDSIPFYAVNVNTADSPVVSLDETTITNDGGGITASDAAFASIVVKASTFYSLGSAIFASSSSDATFVVINSTISGDTRGIAISNSADLALNIISSTITNNTYNGVAVVSANDPSVTISATIIADNALANCSAPIVDGGYNLATDESCGWTQPTSRALLNDSFLDLQGLGSNGGPTATIAIGSNSVAIDAIPLNASGACAVGEQVDQRGVDRPQGLACDIGAYEAPGELKFLPGDTLVVHRGYWAVIRVAVLDASGHNISKRSLHLKTYELDGDGQAMSFVHQFQYGKFNGQPGYQLTINTRNLSPGSWTLYVVVGNSTVVSAIPFIVE